MLSSKTKSNTLAVVSLAVILLLAVPIKSIQDDGCSVEGSAGVVSSQKTFGILTLPVSDSFVDGLKTKLTNAGLPKDRIDKLMVDLVQQSLYYAPYLELQGHKSVPIMFYDDNEKISAQLEELDGVMLTGGDTLFELKTFKKGGLDFFSVEYGRSGPYLSKVKMILDKVKNINQNGRHYPLYGVCLGFEAILLAETNFTYPIAYVNQNNVTSTVTFTKNPSNFKNSFAADEQTDLKENPRMYFYHDLGFLPSDFESFPSLNDNYVIAAKNPVGIFGDEVAAFEHKQWPIFGVQFHPEKTVFDDSQYLIIDRSDKATKLATKFGNVLQMNNSICSAKNSEHENSEIYYVVVENLGLTNVYGFFSRNPDINYLNNTAAAGI